MLLGALGGDQALERRHVHIALEIQAGLRIGGLGNRQVHGARAGELDVGPGGVEMRVRRHHVARLAHHREQNALGGAALVRGDHVAEAGQLVGRPLEAEEALAAGVGFVAAHHRRPLLGGHGAGAGIGEQVDQDVAGFDQEEVVAGLLQVALALFRRGLAQRLHALDAERLDDGAHVAIIAPAPLRRGPGSWYTDPSSQTGMIANDEMYRWIVEAVPEGIWIADPQGRTIFSNRRMAEILGADYESMSARTCFDCIYPDELADAQDRFQRCLEGDRSPFDFRLCRTDGSPVWVSISCMMVCDDSGAPVGLLGLFTDITARKRAEEALRESEGRFRTVADSAPVMLWMSGPDEQVTFFNRRGAEFTGRPAGQLLGSGWLEIIHPDDSEYAQSRYRAAASSKSTDEFEYRARRADGEYRHMLATTCPRFVGDVYAGQIGTMIDITGVKRRQEADLAGQKLEVVGTLAAGIAHDFNNLLGGILAQVELASAEIADGQSPEEPLESIRVVATRGADIVRQLMLYAGQEDQDPELVDVSRLAAETVQLLRLIVAKAGGAGSGTRRGCGRRPRQPGTTAAGADEPGHQCVGGYRRAQPRDSDRHRAGCRLPRLGAGNCRFPARRRLRTAGSLGPGVRHEPGDAGPGVRPVLHHQSGGPRPWTGGRTGHPEGAWGNDRPDQRTRARHHVSDPATPGPLRAICSLVPRLMPGRLPA